MPPRTTKGPTSSPATSPNAGDLFFQPTRTREDVTENDYRNRLYRIQNEAKKVVPTTVSPGSFTLVTKQTKEGFTGETKFDTELSLLRKEEEKMKTEINRYKALADKANTGDKTLYNQLITNRKQELSSIQQNIETLLAAGGDHYMTAKQDASFVTAPTKMRGVTLANTLEKTQHLQTKEKIAAMGKEIVNKREREIAHLKAVVNELQTKNDTLEARIKDQAYQINKLAEGKLPEHLKDTLVRIEFLLKDLKKATEGGELVPPSEEELEEMLKWIDTVLQGKLFGPDVQLDVKQELTSTHDILTSLLKRGEDITISSLTDRGISNEEAEAIMELLKKEGIIHD